MTYRIVKEAWGERALFTFCQIADGKAHPVQMTADNPAWFKTMAKHIDNAAARGPVDEGDLQ